MYKTLVLAIAAAAAAVPTPLSDRADEITPPNHRVFGVTMTVNGTMATLNFTPRSQGPPVLRAERASLGPGTPAYFNGTGMYKALDLDVNGTSYGVGVPEVGDDYGYAGFAFAEKNFQQFQWSVNKGVIYHKLQAALNEFYACYEIVDGKGGYFLKWGTSQSNGKPPKGCEPTVVRQYDVRSSY